jgi:superfamily I DNA/RNA helicase
LQYVGNGKGSLQEAANNKQVIIMTYHSSKGLDFENVFLPFLSWDISISKTKSDILLMVAMTRSKKNLTITYSGNPHALLEKFINDDDIVTSISTNNNFQNLTNLNDIELDF